jgi:hypothetical protein
MQAKTVRPGHMLLHPETKLPLRVVVPKNFHAPADDSTVFAVDDEGGLYAIRPDEPVQVPFSTPLVTQPSDDHYLIVATFERQASDDLPVMRDSFKRGRITADPDDDFSLASQQQLALELQDASDNGMAGLFQCHRVIEGRSFDTHAMGWRTRDEK